MTTPFFSIPVQIALLSLLGYLSGSLMPSLWITRAIKGVDVRDGGSGHATTTNTIRQVGFLPGALVLLIDISKGFFPTYLAMNIVPSPWAPVFVTVSAVIGHCWPVFGGFRGGMGLATAGGGLLAVQPVSVLIALGLLVVLLLTIRHAAKATVFTAVLITPVFWLFGLRGMILWMAGFFSLIISVRFLSNWNRKYRELWLDREKKNTDQPFQP